MTNRQIYKLHLQNQSLKTTNFNFLLKDRLDYCEKIIRPIVHKILTVKDEMQKQYLLFNDDGKIKTTQKGDPVFLLGKSKEEFESEVNKLMDQEIKTNLINHLRLWLFPIRIPFLSFELKPRK